MPIHDPTTNRFSYRPRGDAARFAPYFARLKDALKDRFGSHMPFDDATVIWSPEKFSVIVTFPPDSSIETREAVSHFIFGAFEILGF